MNDAMLASQGEPKDITRWQRAGWVFDLKIDGVRCRAEVSKGKVRLYSRNDLQVTERYPEIVAALEAAYPEGNIVLDGEIAVLGPNGFPDYPLTRKRSAQSRNAARWARDLPAHFFAFDMLSDSENMVGWAYTRRRERLEAEAKKWSPPLVTTPNSPDGERLWEVVTQNGLEGLVAKRPASRYQGGRSADWVKIKRRDTVSCAVGGVDPGKGGRADTFGALHLYLHGPEGITMVGKVGSGFSDDEIAEVMQRLRNPSHAQPLIVDVSYLTAEHTDGHVTLRQPVFQTIRDDLSVDDCTVDQLG